MYTWKTVSPSFNFNNARRAISELALTYTFFSLVPFTKVGNTTLKNSGGRLSLGMILAKWNSTLANNCLTSLLVLFIVCNQMFSMHIVY